MLKPVDKLSPRQRECLRLYWTRQATSKEIALDLGLSKGTVDGYFAEAVSTLGARDRRDAARMAFGDVPIGAGEAPPVESGGDATGVVQAFDWRALLPLRTGAHNDLSISARIVWIVVLAVLLAAGFGAVANGAHVISDILR